MENYNPNSVWGSKEKKYEYTPGKGPEPSSLTGPQAREASGASAPGGNYDSGNKKSFFHGHGLLWFGIGLVVLLVAATIIIIVLKNKPTPQLTLSFSAPSQVLAGNPFIVTVSFSNNSAQMIQNAQLSVLLPNGMSFLNEPQSQSLLSVDLGTIAPGNTSSTNFNVIAAATNANSVQHVSATMTYGAISNPNTQFQSSGNTNIVIGAPALSFSFTIPPSVFSGQNFPIVVSYDNQSPQSISDAGFALTLPPAFTLVSSSIPLATGGSQDNWDLGAIPADASSSFTITGSLNGPANALYALAGTLSGTFEGQTYPVAAQSANMTVAQAPLAIAIELNGSSSYIATAGDELDYTLFYKNNSNITFQAAQITANLTGTMFDFSKLQTDGSFNSVSNTITWNAADDAALASLAPGESGSVEFSLNTKTAYPIHLISDKNFVLKAVGTITSPTVPPDTGGSTGTQSITELNSQVAGAVTIAAQGYFRDPSGIVNSGPFPPKVNKPTDYTVHWVMTNYATDISNVTVSAYLQSGSTFTGVVTSTIASSTPTYDAGTGLVTWTIPLVAATTGVLDKPLEATFQISNTPAVNQVGQIVTLVGQTSLTATDNFTGETLTSSDQPITTQLPDDPYVQRINNVTVSQ